MMRVGIGYDLHPLTPGRPLILGGVTIPFDKGLSGHSDSDVLAHAITDALLGAAALGDIGQHFPDTLDRYKDVDSLSLMIQVVRLVREAGYRIVNVDTNIIAQRPRLAPHVSTMRARVAECLGIHFGGVSIKAKTNEHLGPEGRGEAISVQAVVLLEQHDA